MGSGPLQPLSTYDWKKVAIGAVMAFTGAGLTALLAYVTAWSNTQDFGMYAPFVAAGLSVLANILRKFVQDTRERTA
jgi:hypothetical protein